MTILGWAFMGLAWTVVIALTSFCYWKLLRKTD